MQIEISATVLRIIDGVRSVEDSNVTPIVAIKESNMGVTLCMCVCVYVCVCRCACMCAWG